MCEHISALTEIKNAESYQCDECVKTGELCGKFKWYCASKSPTQSPSSDKVNWHVFGESIQTAKSAPRGSNPVYINAKRRP